MPTFETPGSVSLQIKLPSGRVVVTTADEPRTTVEVVALGRRGQDAIDDIEITMDERSGRFVVRVEQRDRFRWGPIQITWGGDFECRVTCPPGADLDFSGASTQVRVEGDLGEVSARTASGDIRLHAAVVYAALGRLEDAAAELREAVRLDPELEKSDEAKALRGKLGR